MTTSKVEINVPDAIRVKVTDEVITVDLSDGRTVSAPLAWYPRLVRATAKERANWRMVGKGEGIHWTDLDEDVSVEGLLAGRPSDESPASFKRWLTARSKRA